MATVRVSGETIEFDENYYLQRNPDVRSVVERGQLESGLQHYLNFGKAEGREPIPPSPKHQELADAEDELARLFASHNGASFLTPSDLSISPTKIRRVLLIGSCGVQNMARVFTSLGHNVDFIHRVSRAELPDMPPKPADDYDFQVIEIALRSLFSDGSFWTIPYDRIDEHQRVFDNACAELQSQINIALKWNASFNLLTFVTNFARPQENPLGKLLPRYDLRNPAFMIDKLNEVLEKCVLAYPNANVLDLDGLKASYGRRYVQDDSYEHITHHSFMHFGKAGFDRVEVVPPMTGHYDNRCDDLMAGIWNYLVSLYRSVKQIDAIKLVVVDLDDTLWRGVAGDAEVNSADMLEGWPLGILEALGFLKKRGILLAIISKNDESRIRELWPKIMGASFGMDNFVVAKINWRPKTENMKELLAEVNLLPRNTLFIDDHPVERAAMKAEFPDMRVIGRFHLYWRRILLWSSETQVPFITDESSKRTEMVQAQVERETARREMPREEFLASLKLAVTVRRLDSSLDRAFNRAFELANKTNQFNTTGKRWDREEFTGLLNSGGQIYVFEVGDKFTHYGLVGAALVIGPHIVQFVMSCRVAGMDNELAAMGVILECLRFQHSSEITAAFKETDANFLCRDFFAKCGFADVEGRWRFSPENAIVKPSHIDIRFLEKRELA